MWEMARILDNLEPRAGYQCRDLAANRRGPEEIMRSGGDEHRRPDCPPIGGRHFQSPEGQRQLGIGRRIVAQVNPAIGRSRLGMGCRKRVGEARLRDPRMPTTLTFSARSAR